MSLANYAAGAIMMPYGQFLASAEAKYITGQVLAVYDDVPVLGRVRDLWFSSFHPELSGDLRLHQLFLNEVC